MSIELAMPKLGLTMKSGKVSRWLVAEGASVNQGDGIFEVETDKITNTIESPGTGTLVQIFVQAGQDVPVGEVLGILAEPGENIAKQDVAPSEEAATSDDTSAAAPKQASPKPEGPKDYVPASPAAKALAKALDVALGCITPVGAYVREKDVQAYAQRLASIKITPLAKVLAQQANLDITQITGTGEAGKIVRADIERILHPERVAQEAKSEAASVAASPAAASAPAAPLSKAMTGMRKIIADNMYGSLQGSAQLTLVSEADVTPCVDLIQDLRSKHSRDKSFRLSMNDVMIMVVAKALKQHPRMNSTCVDDVITEYEDVNMGIAVSLPEGLIVPVLHKADSLSLLEIAKQARVIAKAARNNSLTPDDLRGGTFTITNLAHSVVDLFTPILKPTETGILGVGRVKEKPVVKNGQVVVRSMMGLSLTFDHRVEDGAQAAEFLGTVVRYLEDPVQLLF